MRGCFAFQSFCEAKSRERVIPFLPVATEVKPRQLRGFYSGLVARRGQNGPAAHAKLP